MLIKILTGIAVALIGFILYVATLPSDMAVSRMIVTKAKPEVIFPYLNHSQKAGEWMPWADTDPNVKMIYSGPAEGVGSKSSWDSPGQMGTGEALVVDSIPLQKVTTQLTYTKPFQMSQVAEISLTPVSEGTQIRWSVKGRNNFFFKAMGVFMNCDKMIGGQFEKGLEKLKSKVE